jgi:CDGSH-type Zn-finger protein
MSGKSQDRPQYAVACSCGARFSLDARGFGKPRPCRTCGATVTVAWGRDPDTHKAVPIAMTQKKAAPRAPEGPSVPSGATAASPAVQDTIKAICRCGYSKRVPASLRIGPLRCPQCGKKMRIADVPADRPRDRIEKVERARPSAPLLPLHLRAPLRVQIKKGAQFFDCPCGERVFIRTGAEGKPIQCHICDRVHALDLDAPPPAPARDSGAPPRVVLPAPSRPLGMGEFLCRCGEIQPPRTSRTGKTFECKKCGRKGNVEIEKSADGNVTVKPTFTSEPGPAAAPATAAVPAPGPVAPSCTCACGQTLAVHALLSKESPSCPGCGRKILMEKIVIPGTTRTMIRPVFGDAAPREEGVVAFEELPPVDLSAPAPVAETAIFDASAGSPDDDAPPTVASDAQIALCDCGAEILVSKRDVGQTIQCPACADVMTVEQTMDPRTKLPILGIRTLGGLDDPEWKLDDFE